MSRTSLTIAANNGDVGGGEVMQLHVARAASELGLRVTVVGPEHPDGLVEAARRQGHRVVRIPGSGRRDYIRNLRAWDRRHRTGVLWCNGLVPGLATSGHERRVLHLHRLPDRATQRLSLRMARMSTLTTLAPSAFMTAQIPGARLFPNWTDDIPTEPQGGVARVGFLGRTTADKGVHVLAEALRQLPNVRLVLAGEPRFPSSRDELLVAPALNALGDRVQRLGWVEPGTFFSSVDLAVFPSVWQEPFGLVVAEAMAARTPYVISDAGALPEVAGADHPFVAAAGNPTDLADKIRQALALSPKERTRLVEGGRQRWERLYSPDAGRERLAALLRELGIMQDRHG